MTDKPKYTMIPIAMLILQTQGEDAAQRWYDSLTTAQQMAYSEELAKLAENIAASFQPIANIWRKQAEVTIAAFTAFAESVGVIGKNETGPV